MNLKKLILFPFLFLCITAFSQDFTFNELKSMIGKEFKSAESYLLQNPNWESDGEAETSRGIRLKYKNKKRDQESEVFNLVDLYKSEKKEVLIAMCISFKSQAVYQNYLNDLKSNGYKLIDSNKKDGKYGRVYKKRKMHAITEVIPEKDADGKEVKTYQINIYTEKKYK